MTFNLQIANCCHWHVLDLPCQVCCWGRDTINLCRQPVADL